MSNFDDYQSDYQAVPASSAAKVLAGQGGKGASGDILRSLTIIPAAVGAGDVSITDGDGVAIKVFATGTLVDLRSFTLHLGLRSVSGAWKITTGTNVSVLAAGRFQ